MDNRFHETSVRKYVMVSTMYSKSIHVLMVFLHVAGSIIAFLAFVIISLAALVLFLAVCIKFPAFGDSFFAVAGFVIALGLILMLTLHICNVNDVIKARNRKLK